MKNAVFEVFALKSANLIQSVVYILSLRRIEVAVIGYRMDLVACAQRNLYDRYKEVKAKIAKYGDMRDIDRVKDLLEYQITRSLEDSC